MLTKTKAIVLTFVVATGLARPGSAAQNDEKDVAAIQKVVEQFGSSIIKRDKATFTALFFSDNPERVNWQFVNDDTRLERFRSIKPDAKKARYIPNSNYLRFIDSVVSNPKSSEEKFSGVSIDTDGEVASVNFDYSYLEGGKQTNWGREMWQLIRTENGWKIISVIWSIHDPIQKPAG